VLALYRRHLKTGFGPDGIAPCPNSGDRFTRKGDKCPMWVEGVDPQGLYHRKSLRTSSWDIAERLLREMLLPPGRPPEANALAKPEPPKAVSLESAITTFLANLEGENRAADTIRKYRLLFRHLRDFADRHGMPAVADFNFEKLVTFRRTWPQKGAETRNKQLDRLKAFFSTCHDAGWIPQNPARKIKPASTSSRMPDPFTPEEQAKILAKPQIARIRCFTHVLFYSALRISDACMLGPTDFDGNRIRRVNKKNQKVVLIPIPPGIKEELDRLPLNGGHYFLIGESTNILTQADAWRTIMNDMFKTDIRGFHCHRFRHTAAVNWLTGKPPLTIEEVAGLLGNSVKVVEKHYATWSRARQQTVEDKLAAGWQKPSKLMRVK
jgi:integrase/recombinase XerD